MQRHRQTTEGKGVGQKDRKKKQLKERMKTMPILIELEQESGKIMINADKIVAVETMPVTGKYKTAVLLADFKDGFVVVKETPSEIDCKVAGQIGWINRNAR